MLYARNCANKHQRSKKFNEENPRHTNFKGIYCGRGDSGISHADEVDARRWRFSRKARKDEALSDINEIYEDAVKELYLQGL